LTALKMEGVPGKRSRTSSDSMNNSDNDMNFDAYNTGMNLNTMVSHEKRKSRNENEKKRRDQFNSLIDDLARLHSHEHKKDKSTILLDTLNFFKNNSSNSKNETDLDWNPPFLSNEEFINLMCEFRNAFYVVFDLNTNIKYVSENITTLLGYAAKDVEFQDMYEFIDPKSGKVLQANLKKRKFTQFDKINFRCTWKSVTGVYEPMKISGFYKRGATDADESQGYFVTIASVDKFSSLTQVYFTDSTEKEFHSQLSMEWKFVNLDPRATQIIGYTPMEVLGTCGYDYCHVDDLEKLIECHKTLLKTGASISNVCRFRTKGQQWISLTTSYNLVFNPLAANSSEPQSVHCTHRLVNVNDQFLAVSNRPLTMATSSSLDSEASESSIKKAMKPKEPEVTESAQEKFNRTFKAKKAMLLKQPPSVELNMDKLEGLHYNQPKAVPEMNTSSSGSSTEDTTKNVASKTTTVNNKIISKILLMSYKQPNFRKHVCTQLLIEKNKCEDAIKQQQLKLKQCEEIISFFQDDDKLEKWVSEVRRSFIQQREMQQSQAMASMQQQSQSSVVANGYAEANLLASNSSSSDPMFNNRRSSDQETSNDIYGHTSVQTPHSLNENLRSFYSSVNDDLLLDNIDVEVLDRLLGDYSFQSLIF